MINFWNWLKTYWKYVLMTIALFLSALLGFLFRGRGKATVLPPVDETQKKIEEQTKTEEIEAAQKRDVDLKKIEETHAEAIAQLNDEQKKQFEEFRDNPDELSSFLLNVGRKLREP